MRKKKSPAHLRTYQCDTKATDEVGGSARTSVLARVRRPGALDLVRAASRRKSCSKPIRSHPTTHACLDGNRELGATQSSQHLGHLLVRFQGECTNLTEDLLNEPSGNFACNRNLL